MVPTLCDVCSKPALAGYRYYRHKKVCFYCPTEAAVVKKTIQTRQGGEATISHGDRFLWNSYKWFVVDFLHEDKDVVVRLEGTSDVATLPEMLVGELVEEFNYSSMYWR